MCAPLRFQRRSKKGADVVARVRRLCLPMLMAVLAFVLLGAAEPPDYEISFRITGFGEQDCESGSGRLVNQTAGPFTVEICVFESDGSGRPDHPLTVEVTNGDGTTQDPIEVTTDEAGQASVRINPTTAGTTTVVVCDAAGCDYGSVEMSASNPPPPPAVASYGGPTTDMGPSESIADGQDDFIDAYTGGPAEESPGPGYEAGDIASFRYLGVEDGWARFEFTTRGDIRSLFVDGAPFAQLAVHVEIPGDARYSLWYRYSGIGDDLTDARSDRARLDGVELRLGEWIDESTGVLRASGVDVPSGSTIRFEIWLSLDPVSSGYWDTAEGAAVPSATPPETSQAPTTTSGGTTESTQGGQTPSSTSATTGPTTSGSTGGPESVSGDEGDGGSFPIFIPIIVLGVIIGGYFIYSRTRKDDEGSATGSDPASGGLVTGEDDSGDDDDTDDDSSPWDDASLLRFFDAEDAKWELSDSDYERWKTLMATDATAAWDATQVREEQVQDRIERLVSEYMDEMSDGIGEFTSAVEAYAGAMGTIIKDSDEIVSLHHEWGSEGGTKDVLWWFDLAEAVIGVARLAVSVGVGATRMAVRLLGASDEAVDAVKVGTAAVEATDEAVDAARTGGRAVSASDDAADSAASAAAVADDVAHDSRLAEAWRIYDGSDLDELEQWIIKVTGRDWDNWADGLVAAARELGYYMDFTHAQRVIIQRLAVKARLAARGNPVVFNPEELAWLHNMSRSPGFWENLRNAAALDIDARVYQMVDETDLGLLRQLADSPEAARAAGDVARAEAAFGAVGDTLPPGGATLPPGNITAAPGAGDSLSGVTWGPGRVPGGVPAPQLDLPGALDDTVVLPTIGEAAANPASLGGLTDAGTSVSSLPGVSGEVIIEGLGGANTVSSAAEIGIDLGLHEGN